MESVQACQGSAKGDEGEAARQAEAETYSQARIDNYSFDNAIARISAADFAQPRHGEADSRLADALLQELEMDMAQSRSSVGVVMAPQPKPIASPTLPIVGVGMQFTQ